MRAWLITGASRGFGLELTKQGLEEGDTVVATARDREMPQMTKVHRLVIDARVYLT